MLRRRVQRILLCGFSTANNQFQIELLHCKHQTIQRSIVKVGVKSNMVNICHFS